MVETKVNIDSKWYILKTMINHEKSVAKRLEAENNHGVYVKCVVPTEKITSVKDTKREFKEIISYPGYVFIETNSLGELIQTVRFIKGSQGFLKEKGEIKSMNQRDVNKMFNIMLESHNDDTFNFKDGDLVKILDGAFTGFVGEVANIKDNNAVVNVTIFGKKTPVEILLINIEKVKE